MLSELRKFDDARNALARAIQARPDFAEAHYNMSFTLSNLGDFEGALRETKRALELDPYYVAQKFELAMDVEYEDPDISIQPDLGGERPADSAITDFSFDPRTLDTLFTGLAPAPTPAQAIASVRNTDSSPFAMATDFLSKGLYDRASAEISRAMARGSARADGLALLGDVYAKQGLYGEALDRYREALRLEPGIRRATIGEAWCLVRLGRAPEARPIAERLLADDHGDVEVLMLTATACAESGDPAAALGVLEAARRVAPMRADIQQKMGDIARSLGDNEGAISAYRHALELDQDFAIVRFQLARLLQGKGTESRSGAGARRGAGRRADVRRSGARAGDVAPPARSTERGAQRCLIELLQRDPYHFDALIALGETLLALGRKRDAVHAFSRVLRFDPSHVGALFHEGASCSSSADIATRSIAGSASSIWDRAREYARRARREIRTASDLQRILGARPRRRRRRGERALADGDRRTASRARNSRRLSAARPEPEDGRAARLVRASRGRRPRRVRRRPRRSGDDSKQGDVDGARAAPGRSHQRSRPRASPRAAHRPARVGRGHRPARRDRGDHAEGARAPAAAAHRERGVRADVVARRLLLVRGADPRRHADRFADHASRPNRSSWRRARRIDEWSRIADLVPNPGVIPELAPVAEDRDGNGGAGGSMLDLLPHEWQVLTMIDGGRDLRAIAASLGARRIRDREDRLRSRDDGHHLPSRAEPDDAGVRRDRHRVAPRRGAHVHARRASRRRRR